MADRPVMPVPDSDPYGNDDWRTVRLVVEYRLRVPAGWDLDRLDVDRSLTPPPMHYSTGTVDPAGGPGTWRTNTVPPLPFMTYRHRFDDESRGDWPPLEVGRCGDRASHPDGHGPICCLPAGHAGWHRGDSYGEYRDGRIVTVAAPEWSASTPDAEAERLRGLLAELESARFDPGPVVSEEPTFGGWKVRCTACEAPTLVGLPDRETAVERARSHVHIYADGEGYVPTKGAWPS